MASTLKKVSSALRIATLCLWGAVILFCLASLLIYPQAFTAANIAGFLLRFEGEIWLVYLTLSALRGFTLLPSTPLVIAGTLIYPDQPFLVLAVSLAGILVSSGMIYYFSELLGFSEYFESHKPELIDRIHRRLEHPAGVLFVAGWAFFPLVPTDAVCYVAGTARMNFFKFISAVLIGELILCSVYIFLGGSLMSIFS